MSRQGWVSTILVVLLILAALAGAYLYQSLYKEMTELEGARDEAVSETEHLKQELNQARQRLEQRSTSADVLEAQLNETRQALADATGELTRSQQRAENLEAEIDKLQEELASSQALARTRDQELTRSQNRIDELDEQLAASEARIAELETRREELQQSLTTSREEQAHTRSRADVLADELKTTRNDLEQARDELAQRKEALDEVSTERQSVAEQYRQAREQLALQQARSLSAGETIEELEARLQRERSAMDNLQTRLQELSNEKQTLVSRLEDGTTVIKLPEKILFDSGSARIGQRGRETLQLLATALESFPDHLISVQGHTDSRPISPRLQNRYPTNWELSAARATSAVRILKDTGITPERMQAVGYADTRPLVEETDAASRRMNRRIEVLLYPDQFNIRTHSGINAD